MKILHLAMHDATGAGRATMRLHQALMQANLDSTVLVTQKSTDIPKTRQPGGKIRLYQKLQQKLMYASMEKSVDQNQYVFSVNVSPSFLTPEIKALNPDLIHLHWIGWEYLPIESLQNFNVPLVWTMHDMWTFTGGCHYSEECTRYRENCGHCPQLKQSREQDLSRWVWKRKSRAWSGLNLTLVAPSQWLANCAQQSSIGRNFPVKVIANGLDTSIYKPMDRQEARKRLNLPLDRKLVLFGAARATSDRRKGYHLLLEALYHLDPNPDTPLELIVFGASQPETETQLPFKTHYLGKFQDDISLSLLYACADVFVLPSLYDNLPNTLLEAIACGTPCVAFEIGGNPDIIQHQINGYLAKPYNTEDLAQGITWVLADEHHHTLATQARAIAETRFTLQHQTQQYLNLYSILI